MNAYKLVCTCSDFDKSANLTISKGRELEHGIRAEYHDIYCPINCIAADLNYLYEMSEIIACGDAISILDALRQNRKDFLV